MSILFRPSPTAQHSAPGHHLARQANPPRDRPRGIRIHAPVVAAADARELHTQPGRSLVVALTGRATRPNESRK